MQSPKLQALPHTGSQHPGNLGCHPGSRAPGSKEISDSVHLGLVLASSHHLQQPSLGTQQWSSKNWLNEPLEHKPVLGCQLPVVCWEVFSAKNNGKAGISAPRNELWNYSHISVVFSAGSRITYHHSSSHLLGFQTGRVNKWTQEMFAWRCFPPSWWRSQWSECLSARCIHRDQCLLHCELCV